MPQFSDLSAVLLNCSLVHDGSKSHTRRLLSRVAGVMETEGVAVELVHLLEHRIGFGMVKDTTSIGDEADDWPEIHRRIMAADILVVGTPIWLGVKSSHIGYTIPPQATVVGSVGSALGPATATRSRDPMCRWATTASSPTRTRRS